MSRQPPNPVNDQHRRFVETARQLECDEDKERFEENLKQVAKPKPTTDTTAKKRGRRP